MFYVYREQSISGKFQNNTNGNHQNKVSHFVLFFLALCPTDFRFLYMHMSQPFLNNMNPIVWKTTIC